MIPNAAKGTTKRRRRIPGILKLVAVVSAVYGMVPSPASGDIIRGAVTASAGGAPLDSVKVLLDKTSQIFTYTNASGTYTLNTNVAVISGMPAQRNLPSLAALLRGAGNGASIRVYDTRGVLVWEKTVSSEARDAGRLVSRLSTGMYAVTVKTGTTTSCFWLCKLGSGVHLFPGKAGVQAASAPTKGAATSAEHLVRFTKKGYYDITKTVQGSQDNVNCAMAVNAYCGNGLLDQGEVCDGDTRPCNLIDAMKYASGAGACNDVCSGYAQNACVAHPVSDVSGNAHGADHRRAAEITAWAQFNVIKRLQPGMKEGDLHAIIDSVYKSMPGYSGYAFGTITGSGPNSTDLHYEGKTRVMQSGDVVVVDIGAKSNDYCADLTRTYPVNGKFTPRQREIYQLVLDAQKAAFAALKTKNQSLNSLQSVAVNVFRNSPLRAKDNSGVSRTMDYFFIHGLSHFIGKTVHGTDLPYSGSYGSQLQTGWLFSIEPGLYIQSEKFGVRIEDDYMWTANGPVNIFPNTPVEADHIEALMALRRLPDQPTNYPEAVSASKAGNDTRSDHMDF